jgi:F-type H+-transporting ATPase subunit c
MTALMAVVLGLALAVASAAIAQSNALGKALEGIARQPEARGPLMQTLIIGLAFIESLVLYVLLIAIIVIFVKS